MAKSEKKTIKIKKGNQGSRKTSYKWVVTILIWTFFLSCGMQMIQAGLMNKVTISVAFLILLAFIFIGIIFDIIGVSVTAASEVPFHSLASRKVRGAKEAIWLIRNADKVGNFCNDVIGDICGIITGSAATTVVTMMVAYFAQLKTHSVLLAVVMAGLVAALTVGGKAFGKGIAMSNCNQVIFSVGKIISIFTINKKTKRG